MNDVRYNLITQLRLGSFTATPTIYYRRKKSHQWVINGPEGDTIFYGTRDDVISYIRGEQTKFEKP